jgi:hypothetical protein
MSDARDDRWLSISDLKEEILKRSTLSPRDFDQSLREAVTGDSLTILSGPTGVEMRWPAYRQRHPSLSCWKDFICVPDVRLNLGKFIWYLETLPEPWRVKIARPVEEEVVDLDTKVAGSGRKAEKIWQAVEDDLLLWIDRNGMPGIKADLERWVKSWFLDRGYEDNHSAKKTPADSTIRDHVTEVVKRFRESEKRQNERSRREPCWNLLTRFRAA